MLTLLVVLFIALLDALGLAFAGLVLLSSLWIAYQWIIKPDREARERRAQEFREEIHRTHWENWKRNSSKQAPK